VERGSDSAGLVIDGLPFIRTVSAEQRFHGRDPLPPLLQPHVGAGFALDDDYLFELDHRTLLGALLPLMHSQ